MSQQKITELPSATAIVNTDLYVIEQADGTKSVTGAILKAGLSDPVTSLAWGAITDTPNTLAGYSITDAATAGQGSLADTAVQPGSLALVATTGKYTDLTLIPATFAPIIGSGATQAVAGNDSRLTDSRTPTAHKNSHKTAGGDPLTPADIGAAPATGIAPSAITGTAVVTADSRLTDARTPTTHKSTHATGGSDVLSPTDIGLGNVDNTSDANKPLSTATTNALNLKLNATKFTGAGNLVLAGNLTTAGAFATTLTTTAATSLTLPTSGTLATTAQLGEPTITAGTTSQYWRGDKSWQTLNSTSVGLANVDNTSDVNKPLSTATTNALNLKLNASRLLGTGVITANTTGTLGGAALLSVGTIAGTVAAGDDSRIVAGGTALQPTGNGSTLTGLTKTQVGLANVDNTSDVNKPLSTATTNALNLKANLASPTFTGTVAGISKTMVGLSNVDNTTDLLKPVSTATQNALNLKLDATRILGSGTLTVNTSGTLGGAAFMNSGTGAGTLALGNDSRIIAGGTALQPDGNGSALTDMIWSQIGSTPTTVSGYGITDTVTVTSGTASVPASGSDVTFVPSGTSPYINFNFVPKGVGQFKIAGNSVTLGGFFQTGGPFFTDSNFYTYGKFPLILRVTAATDVTLPVSGTLATVAQVDAMQSKTTYVSPPAGPTSAGTQGQEIISGNYLYKCIATNTWLRAQLLTW